jgi:hypothetical protein
MSVEILQIVPTARACRYQITLLVADRISGMAQRRSTHKGDRAQIMARPHRMVYEIVKRESAELGIPMGQYVADVLAMYVGHPELVRELNKDKQQSEELPLAM